MSFLYFFICNVLDWIIVKKVPFIHGVIYYREKLYFRSKITHFGDAIYLYSACIVLAIEKLDFGNPNKLCYKY